ncbi:MAG: PIN domain-containing protein [Alphaproteobacteria bacterium]|nr:PIN domain-containing protein [Alphaproteobacteria bacterium]
MKDLFPGHFQNSDEDYSEIWKKCIFVFDANILLNFYRYSDSTREEFLNLLKTVGQRIWIPHRAAEEYLGNRLSVIDDQKSHYNKTIVSLKELREKLEHRRQHPFVEEETLNAFNSSFDKLIEELEQNEEKHGARISEDEIMHKIGELFCGRVGKPFQEEDLKKILEEGKDRYKNKIPPGYEDVKKSGDSDVFTDKCRKYGDYILWEQILLHASENKKDVVFVTDDLKEDWWLIHKGKTIGPRPELIAEFLKRTKKKFYMYKSDRFLEHAKTNLDSKVSDDVVAEIRDLRNTENLYKSGFVNSKNYYLKKNKDIESTTYQDLLAYNEKYSQLKELLDYKRSRLQSIYEYSNERMPDGFFDDSYKEIRDLEVEIEKTLAKKSLIEKTIKAWSKRDRLNEEMNERIFWSKYFKENPDEET